MQKLLTLIKWSTKARRGGNMLEQLEVPITVNTNQLQDEQDEDTRPTYRIGNHDPADVQKAIDLAG